MAAVVFGTLPPLLEISRADIMPRQFPFHGETVDMFSTGSEYAIVVDDGLSVIVDLPLPRSVQFWPC